MDVEPGRSALAGIPANLCKSQPRTPIPNLGFIQRAAEVQRLRSRLDAVLGQHLTAASNTAGLTPSYRGIPVTDIAAGSRTNPKPLRGAVLLHRWLEAFPVFADAHREGVLSTEHRQELRRAGRALAYWINAADPDGLQPTEDLRNKPTGLSHRTNVDGSVDGRFHLDPLAAQLFNTAVGTEPKDSAVRPACRGLHQVSVDGTPVHPATPLC